MKKYPKIALLLLGTIGTLCAFFLPTNTIDTMPSAYASDILGTVFEPAEDQNLVLNPWTPNTIGNRFFRWVWIIWGEESRKDPIFVRIAKVFLELAIVLWVTMCIVLWIRYVLAQWDDSKQKKIMGYFWNILAGVLIALAADVIIILVRSFSQSSITPWGNIDNTISPSWISQQEEGVTQRNW